VNFELKMIRIPVYMNSDGVFGFFSGGIADYFSLLFLYKNAVYI
jgi:hypothetical protein